MHNEVARRQSNPHVCTVMSVLLSTLVWLCSFQFFSACVFQLATRAINQRLYVWRSADWRAMITRRDESRDHATHVVLFTVGRMS